jgi:tetratricopeptide (TPR) repeat protein
MLTMASGAPLQASVMVEDFLAIRWMGAFLSNPDDAARATATAGRLLTIWGQRDVAQSVIATSTRRDVLASPTARALLLWAEAETLIASGSFADAKERTQRAETLLRDAKNLETLARLTNRQADVLAIQGQFDAAADLQEEVRRIYRELDAPVGVSASLRSAADLSVSHQDLDRASTLYAQSAENTDNPIEVANRLIGLAGLAIAEEDHDQAGVMLDKAGEMSLGLPLIQANVYRRRADLFLHQEMLEEAGNHAEQALTLYTRAGEPLAAARSMRLAGDIAALRNDPAAASQHYLRALTIQAEQRDLLGLHQTLQRAFIVESTAGDAAVSRQLQEFLSALAPESRPPIAPQ